MIKSISDIDKSTEEGKLLLAALAKISTESQTNKQPDEILQQVNDLKIGMFGGFENMKLAEAVKVLQEELAKDKEPGSYYGSWQANIAQCMMSEFQSGIGASLSIDTDILHKIVNEGVKNFLDLFISR